jgi:Flp pilus assembly protein TadG
MKDERGQTLVLVALGMLGFIGIAGVSIDLGRGYNAIQQLQASTNAAALAGAAALPNTTVAANNVTAYSSMTGGKNTSPTLQNANAVPTFACYTAVTNMNIPCMTATGSTSGSFNAMQVVQTAQVPSLFGKMFGLSYYNISATATAAMRGLGAPINLAIILDATLSQNSTDDDCGSGVSELSCQLNGVLKLLQELYPCAAKYNTSGCPVTSGVATASVDRVALFTFPALTASTASVDANCTTSPVTLAWVTAHGSGRNSGWQSDSTFGYYSMEGSAITVGSGKSAKTYTFAPTDTATTSGTGIWPHWPVATTYSYPTAGASSYAPGTGATYEVTLGLGAGDANGFFSDYRASDTAQSLNASSLLVQAAGGGASGCGGIATPNYDGDIGTYYAGALYAAQASLVAEQSAHPSSDNVIIILSDGNATAPSASSSPGGSSFPAMSAGGGGTYPSYKNECQQAVTAAQYATNHGTTVYSIAYGSPSSGCASDSSLTPCQTMKLMASGATSGSSTDSSYFYSDFTQSGSNSTCTSSISANNNSISNIFANIGMTFQRARLIPNGTT